jgi:4a-hydroxytetrahydrobiopterin dehydratase
MAKLSTVQIKMGLKEIPEWTKRNRAITRTYRFKDFVAAMKFVNAVAKLAEKAAHHPDIDIRWNQVTLTLTTHDQGGLTDKDFALARQADRLAA